MTKYKKGEPGQDSLYQNECSRGVQPASAPVTLNSMVPDSSHDKGQSKEAAELKNGVILRDHPLICEYGARECTATYCS